MTRLTIVYLIIATLFAWTHYFAVIGSLYWYYWWFDIMMHFWGGLLIGAGVHVLCGLKNISLQPTLPLLILTLVLITGSWEVFEWYAGLYDHSTHTIDTAQDIAVGFIGGVIAFFILKYKKHHLV